jgi:hypothetical protein
MRKIKFQPRSCKLPPTIRLAGQWLVAAGFQPCEHVEVIQSAPGELLIRRPAPTEMQQATEQLRATFAAIGL